MKKLTKYLLASAVVLANTSLLYAAEIAVIDNGSTRVKAGLISVGTSTVDIASTGVVADDLDAAYTGLGVAATEQGVLVVHPVSATTAQREALVDAAFGAGAPSMALASDAVAALFASGRITGVVVNVDGTGTRVTPVHEGVALSTSSSSVGGESLKANMATILTQRGYSFTTPAEIEIAGNILDTLGYVAPDFDAEMYTASTSSSIEAPYELPDGQIITIGNERFRAPEALFQPAFLGLEESGIQQLTYDSIMSCAAGIRGTLYSNIVLTGKSSMFPGLAARLDTEVTALAGTSVSVVAPIANAAWVGGADMASLSAFQAQFVSSEYYGSNGASAVVAQF